MRCSRCFYCPPPRTQPTGPIRWWSLIIMQRCNQCILAKHLLGKSYPSAEIQWLYSKAPLLTGSMRWGSLTPLQRFRWCILHTRLTGPNRWGSLTPRQKYSRYVLQPRTQLTRSFLILFLLMKNISWKFIKPVKRFSFIARLDTTYQHMMMRLQF